MSRGNGAGGVLLLVMDRVEVSALLLCGCEGVETLDWIADFEAGLLLNHLLPFYAFSVVLLEGPSFLVLGVSLQ